MYKLTGRNLEDFCRTCLRSLQTKIVSTKAMATSSTLFGYSLAQWPELLKLVITLTAMDEHADFPRSLCQLCYDKLIDIQEFQKVIVRTTNKLRDMLLTNDNCNSDAITLQKLDHNNDDNDKKLLLPEFVPILVKTEQIDIEETQLQENQDLLQEQEIKIENITTADECESVDDDNEYDNDDDDSFGDEADADDADDEEFALRNGAANSSSCSMQGNQSQLRKERNKKSLQCPRCEKHAYKKVYLDAHIRAVHEGYDKPFLCESCQKAFTRYQHLREHIQSIHELKEQIMCTYNGCNTTFTTQNLLQSHFKIRHDIDESDKFAMGLQEMLDMHSTTKLSEESIQNMCFQCSRPYSSKRALSEHLKRHAKIKDHVCQVCGVAKVTRTELITHMRTHEPNAEKFKCNICPQQFNHKNAITRHVRVVHEGQRRYECSFCSKRFGTRNAQMCHERLHTGERPFSCSMCEKSFAQSEALKTHMKRHDNSLLQNICSYCAKVFTTRKNLKDHEKSHQVEKPFICRTCNLGFLNADDLDVHENYHIDNPEPNKVQS